MSKSMGADWMKNKHILVPVLLANLLWINASEIFRYFAFVMPMMRETLSMVPDVAPMSLSIFLIWGAWDTILLLVVTFFCWVYLDRYGATMRNAVFVGTILWCAIFVIFWIACLNMNLAAPKILVTALPLAWIEMVVAALIVRWGIRRLARRTDFDHTAISIP